MDFGMSPVVLLLAVLMFVVSADELVLQLNGELGSFPESMILTKIQMGVIDPTPIVNGRGLRYFIQIARNNVVVYPTGIQTIVPHNRKRYDRQRLVPITGNRLRCTSCGSNYQTQKRTTPPPSAFSAKAKTVWPKAASPGEPVKTPGSEERPQPSSVKTFQQTGTSQSVKLSTNNQSKQAVPDGASVSSSSSSAAAASASHDQQIRRTLVDVLKPGTGRDINAASPPMNSPDRTLQAVNEQAQNGVDTIDVLRGLIHSIDAQNPVLFPERFYQRQQNTQQSQPKQAQDQYYQTQNRFQQPQDLPHQQSQSQLQQQTQDRHLQSQGLSQQQSQDQTHQQPQDQLHQQSQDQLHQQSQDQLHQQSQDQPNQQPQNQLHQQSQDQLHQQPQDQLHQQPQDQLPQQSQDQLHQQSQDQIHQQSQDQLHQQYQSQLQQQLQDQLHQQSQDQLHRQSPNQARHQPAAGYWPQDKQDTQPQHQTATHAATSSTTTQKVTNTMSTPPATTAASTTPNTNTDSSNGLTSSD